jgi:hypothetical protein
MIAGCVRELLDARQVTSTVADGNHSRRGRSDATS